MILITPLDNSCNKSKAILLDRRNIFVPVRSDIFCHIPIVITVLIASANKINQTNVTFLAALIFPIKNIHYFGEYWKFILLLNFFYFVGSCGLLQKYEIIHSKSKGFFFWPREASVSCDHYMVDIFKWIRVIVTNKFVNYFQIFQIETCEDPV